MPSSFMNAYSVSPRNSRCSGCDSGIARNVLIVGAPHPWVSTVCGRRKSAANEMRIVRMRSLEMKQLSSVPWESYGGLQKCSTSVFRKQHRSRRAHDLADHSLVRFAPEHWNPMNISGHGDVTYT